LSIDCPNQLMLHMCKKSFLILALLAIATACQKQTKSPNQDKAASTTIGVPHANKTLNYEGTYQGVLPCADCDGLETTISLNENNTYAIQSQYLGKGNKIFEQRGTFTWNKTGSVVVFDNIDNAPNQYAVGKNTLTQLDLEGNLITGSLAKEYILSKQEKKKLESSGSGQLEKPVINLNNKIVAQTVIKKINPAVGKVTLAETKWKLTLLNGKTIKHQKKALYFLKLNSKDGRFNAFVGCKSLSGNYIMPSPAAIAFTNIISTMKACDNTDTEKRFTKVLEETDTYAIEDNMLYLKKGKKKVLATFEPFN
jgi:copper homeostasis protein (lipoprotein)